MYLLGLAILLSLLKLAEVGPVAAWSWWPILGVYAAAAAWWAWADASGYTKRKAAQRMEQRKKERIERQKQAMTPGQRRR
ncbi:TIGR04438 family Trp-rich protein [Comamonas guangdongensis]|uniref:TIGR04438 family Trp-rich protein n=1 Tax=Comamonas guangdongensis TaxID=510515 RepID=A0ABV3ZXY7_9BURK